jgi:hypothetical protein
MVDPVRVQRALGRRNTIREVLLQVGDELVIDACPHRRRVHPDDRMDVDLELFEL